MLNESGIVKLSDFGFRKRYYARDFDGSSICEVLMYLAPEVFEDGTELKKTTIGRVMYWMVSRMARVCCTIEMVLLCMMGNG